MFELANEQVRVMARFEEAGTRKETQATIIVQSNLTRKRAEEKIREWSAKYPGRMIRHKVYGLKYERYDTWIEGGQRKKAAGGMSPAIRELMERKRLERVNKVHEANQAKWAKAASQ